MRAFWETDMMWQRKLAAPAIGLMIAAAGFAWASEQKGGLASGMQTHSAAIARRAAGPADALSPGNRLIAEALFAAQRAPGANAEDQTPWPLERIAASRIDGHNWGEVFQQMKVANLLQAETLGQVVTWYQYNYVQPEPNPYETRSSIATVPTTERNYGN